LLFGPRLMGWASSSIFAGRGRGACIRFIAGHGRGFFDGVVLRVLLKYWWWHLPSVRRRRKSLSL
jgi:hypothetical protein